MNERQDHVSGKYRTHCGKLSKFRNYWKVGTVQDREDSSEYGNGAVRILEMMHSSGEEQPLMNAHKRLCAFVGLRAVDLSAAHCVR